MLGHICYKEGHPAEPAAAQPGTDVSKAPVLSGPNLPALPAGIIDLLWAGGAQGGDKMLLAFVLAVCNSREAALHAASVDHFAGLQTVNAGFEHPPSEVTVSQPHAPHSKQAVRHSSLSSENCMGVCGVHSRDQRWQQCPCWVDELQHGQES